MASEIERLQNTPEENEIIDAKKVKEDTNRANANLEKLELNMVQLSADNFFTGKNTLAQVTLGNTKFISTTYTNNVEHLLNFNSPVALIDATSFNLTAKLPEITTADIGKIIHVMPINLTNTIQVLTTNTDVLDVDGNNKIEFSSLDGVIKLMAQKLGKWIILSSNDITLSVDS